MSKHSLTRRSEYNDVVHRRFAGTPLEIAGCSRLPSTRIWAGASTRRTSSAH